MWKTEIFFPDWLFGSGVIAEKSDFRMTSRSSAQFCVRHMNKSDMQHSLSCRENVSEYYLFPFLQFCKQSISLIIFFFPLLISLFPSSFPELPDGFFPRGPRANVVESWWPGFWLAGFILPDCKFLSTWTPNIFCCHTISDENLQPGALQSCTPKQPYSSAATHWTVYFHETLQMMLLNLINYLNGIIN